MIATRTFLPIGATSGSAPSTTVDNFIPFCATTNPTWQTSIGSNANVIATSFNALTLRIDLTVAPGGVASRTFTVVKNGVDTGLTVAITGAATTGSVTSTVSFVDGDTLILRCTPAGTPAATSAYGYLLIEGAANEGFPIFGGNYSQNVTTTDTFLPLQGFTNIVWDTDANTKQVFPMYGQLQNWRVTLNGAPGAGTSFTFEVYVNGAASGMSITIAGTNTTGTDTTHAVVVSPGDLLSVRATKSGATANRTARWGLECIPSAPGYSALMYRNFNTQQPSTSANRFQLPTARGIGAFNATETNAQNICPAITAKNLYVWQSVAPGAAASGKQYVHTLRKNAAGASPAVTILETATTGNNTADLSYSDGDKISLLTAPTATPAATDLSVGMMFYLTGSFIADVARPVTTTRATVM